MIDFNRFLILGEETTEASEAASNAQQAATNPKDATFDWNDVLHVVAEWLTTTGLKIIISLLVMAITFKIIDIFSKRITKKLQKKKADATLSKVLVSFIRVVLKVLVIIAIVGYLGFETASLSAVIASCGVGLSLAVQGTLSNFAAGVIIIIMRPFKLGDFIESNGQKGTVEDIKLFYTTVISPDNKVIRIPNNTLANNVIVNVNEKPERRVEVIMSVSYDSDLKRAKDVLKEVCYGCNTILKDREPFVEIGEYADSSVEIKCRVWVKTPDYWSTYWYLLDEMREALALNHIEIPYKQIDVHVKKD